MSAKQLTNFGVLMDLLSITTVELSKAINIERTSISRWRHGANKILTDMPYFADMVNYFAEKNENLGNELLEDFFESVYPVKKSIHEDYIKRCVRSYILNIPDSILISDNDSSIQLSASSYMNVAKCIGAEGRMQMFNALLETAEKLPTPSVIKVFEADQFNWVVNNTNQVAAFYINMKRVLDMGHKIEIIFLINEHFTSSDMHHIFLEFAFHENMFMYIFWPKAGIAHVRSIYTISERVAIVGYYFGNLKSMLSCVFRDRLIVEAQEMIWENYKRASALLTVTTKQADYEKMISLIDSSVNRNGEYFYSGNVLSIATMSGELLDEVLNGNNLTKEQKKLCYDFYRSLRKTVECSSFDSISGFYYILDEITAPLSYPTSVNDMLSVISGKSVQITKAQYLRHFMDTAELLLTCNRYRVLLHHNPVHSVVQLSRPKFIWYKSECWAIIMNTDSYSGKSKLILGDYPKTSTIFQVEFMDIISLIPEYKKDNAYVAELFMKIAGRDIGK